MTQNLGPNELVGKLLAEALKEGNLQEKPKHWFTRDYQDKLVLETALELYVMTSDATEDDFKKFISDTRKLVNAYYQTTLNPKTRGNN